MTSTYTKARLEYTLKVFRGAREDAKHTASSKLQRHLRNDYGFRQANATSNLPHAATWDEDDASSDEYNPEIPKKRRLTVPKTPKPKRRKQDPQIANQKHTTTSEVSLEPFPGLVTLKFKSSNGKFFLNALAGQYGTGYEKQDSDENDDARGRGQRQTGKTYLEKQDEESGKIDKGTTRSGLRRKFKAPTKGNGHDTCPTCRRDVSGTLPCNRCKSEGPLCTECNTNKSQRVAASSVILTPANTEPTPLPSPAGERSIDEIRRLFSEYHALGVQQNPIILDSPSPSPTPKPVVKPQTPSIFTITTPWAHPMQFKYDAKLGPPCHFCNDFRYGVYGYGLIEAKVFRKVGETQLEETEDSTGHRSQGKEATRMCVECSLKRLFISRCRAHSIKQFGAPSDAQFKFYIGQLLDKRYPNGPALKAGVYYTCSLCTQPAFWRCVADQRLNRYGQQVSEEQGKGRGCGLLLCTSCAGNLQAEKGILKKTTVQKPNGHDCRRADMQFLFPGSLLHKAYR